METYYKIVRVDLTSCFTLGKARVRYILGKYVTALNWLPKVHRVLFVFDSLKLAHDFFSLIPYSSIKREIYECKVRGVKHLPSFLSANALTLGTTSLTLDHQEFPAGTVAVKKVKLTKLWRR